MADQDHAPVVGDNGLRGTVLGPSQNSPNEVAIALEDGREISVLPSALTLQPGGVWHLRTVEEPEETTIPIISEDLDIAKRKQTTGKVRVEKQSVPHYQAVSMPLTRETAEVRRVMIDKPVNGPMPVRREGDTIIMPVVEEVATVHKQLVLKEEIHITRRRRTEQHEETVQLRSEQAKVSRTDSAGQPLVEPAADPALQPGVQPGIQPAGQAPILPPDERSILDPTKPRPSILGPRRS